MCVFPVIARTETELTSNNTDNNETFETNTSYDLLDIKIPVKALHNTINTVVLVNISNKDSRPRVCGQVK